MTASGPHLVFLSMPFGGIEVYWKNLRRRIEGRNGLRSTWITIDWNDRASAPLAGWLPWNWTVHGSLLARERIGQVMREGPVDAIVLNHTIPAMALGRIRKKIPVAISMDVTPEILRPFEGHYQVRRALGPWSPTAVRDRWLRRIFDDAALLMPWSDLVQSSLRQTYGVPPEKMSVVRPGVDLGIWSVDDEALRRRHDGPFRVLFVGADFERKGGDLLLRVAADPRCASWEFHIVSRSAPTAVGPNVTVYRDLAANSEPLRALFARCSALVLPTRADISPNVIAEAMSMGLPVVATAVGAIPELVRDGTTGFVVPVDDAELLGSRLHQLAADGAMRRAFSAAALDTARREFDLDRCADRVIGLVTGIIDQHTRGV